MTTKNASIRGRPRRFDAQAAVAIAQDLFHAKGYDAVSVTDVTSALSINPPSFYSAFGSKMGLYTLVLDRWSATDAIPLADILREDCSVAEAIADLLNEAATRYSKAGSPSGCLVLEGTHCVDPEARDAACAARRNAEKLIRDYIALRYPADAERVADFVSMSMSGLSAMARAGHDKKRLLASARLAASALSSVLDR